MSAGEAVEDLFLGKNAPEFDGEGKGDREEEEGETTTTITTAPAPHEEPQPPMAAPKDGTEAAATIMIEEPLAGETKEEEQQQEEQEVPEKEEEEEEAEQNHGHEHHQHQHHQTLHGEQPHHHHEHHATIHGEEPQQQALQPEQPTLEYGELVKIVEELRVANVALQQKVADLEVGQKTLLKAVRSLEVHNDIVRKKSHERPPGLGDIITDIPDHTGTTATASSHLAPPSDAVLNGLSIPPSLFLPLPLSPPSSAYPFIPFPFTRIPFSKLIFSSS